MKQVIVIRQDLSMSTGKLAAQACHASLGAYKKTDKKAKKEWGAGGAKKVVLGCSGLKELKDLELAAKKMKVPSSLVTDAGHTELPPGTITALGIGPGDEKVIDKITGELKLI
ncbi:peptidyl-tRNA hydrolase [archaeon]|nr:peptidyl-tRNA hydrolase [archaeon]